MRKLLGRSFLRRAVDFLETAANEGIRPRPITYDPPMRRLALLLALSSCDASSAPGTAAAGASGQGGEAGTGGEASTGGSGPTSVSVSVSVSATSATSGGGGSGGDGGAASSSSTVATTTVASTTAGSGGGGADPGCPSVPCDYGGGYECDNDCGNENQIICVGVVCNPFEAFTIGGTTTIITPPIDGPSDGCFSNCPGDVDSVWWLARVLVRDDKCVSAIGPEGSIVMLENPNVKAHACQAGGENCLTISNLSGEDRFLALVIPAGMVTESVVFTVNVYDGAGNCAGGALDCEAAGCNGAGD